MTNKENTLKDSIELSVEDNNDNDDDWDTDADYVNTSFMGKLPSGRSEGSQTIIHVVANQGCHFRDPSSPS
jgi:hypothetical protein